MRTLAQLATLALFLTAPTLALAASTLPIQGVVRDNSGAIVTDGAFAMT